VRETHTVRDRLKHTDSETHTHTERERLTHTEGYTHTVRESHTHSENTQTHCERDTLSCTIQHEKTHAY